MRSSGPVWREASTRSTPSVSSWSSTPTGLILASIRASREVLRRLRATGSVAGLVGEVASFTEFFDLLGMTEVQRLEESYGVPEDARARYS
jgi:hypothetical protein